MAEQPSICAGAHIASTRWQARLPSASNVVGVERRGEALAAALLQAWPAPPTTTSGTEGASPPPPNARAARECLLYALRLLSQRSPAGAPRAARKALLALVRRLVVLQPTACLPVASGHLLREIEAGASTAAGTRASDDANAALRELQSLLAAADARDGFSAGAPWRQGCRSAATALRACGGLAVLRRLAGVGALSCACDELLRFGWDVRGLRAEGAAATAAAAGGVGPPDHEDKSVTVLVPRLWLSDAAPAQARARPSISTWPPCSHQHHFEHLVGTQPLHQQALPDETTRTTATSRNTASRTSRASASGRSSASASPSPLCQHQHTVPALAHCQHQHLQASASVLVPAPAPASASTSIVCQHQHTVPALAPASAAASVLVPAPASAIAPALALAPAPAPAPVPAPCASTSTLCQHQHTVSAPALASVSVSGSVSAGASTSQRYSSSSSTCTSTSASSSTSPLCQHQHTVPAPAHCVGTSTCKCQRQC